MTNLSRFLKYGITTGATAAAASKAALIALLKEPVDRVVIPTPIGLRFEVQVKSSRKIGDTAEAIVVKDAGQDIELAGWKWFLNVMENQLGSLKFEHVIREYMAEREKAK